MVCESSEASALECLDAKETQLLLLDLHALGGSSGPAVAWTPFASEHHHDTAVFDEKVTPIEGNLGKQAHAATKRLANLKLRCGVALTEKKEKKQRHVKSNSC